MTRAPEIPQLSAWHPPDDGYAQLHDHDSFVNGVPHRTFARLRREDPVAWCDGDAKQNMRGFWSLTRYDDIMEYNRNFELLSSAQGIRMEDQTREEYLARRTFQETDPPEHTRVRMRVAKAFSRPVIAAFESTVRELCDDILTRALALQEFDAVAEVARQLPMRMLGRILGAPDADLDWLVSKGDELIANTDPEYSRHLPDKDDTEAFRLLPFRSPAGAELWEYANQLVENNRQHGGCGDNNGGDGVLDLILRPDDNGETITPVEFRNFFCLLVAAGNDTTRYSIAAAIHALANHPELLRQLRDGGDEIWKTAPDEFIRWASPTLHFRRTATRDFDLHGKRIRAGDKVVLWFVSGNRDDAHFNRPFTLDPARQPNRHMAFGQGGPHICLGIWLARLEVRVMLQELTRRVRSLQQTAAHDYLRSNFVTGIKRLPVTVTAA